MLFPQIFRLEGVSDWSLVSVQGMASVKYQWKTNKGEKNSSLTGYPFMCKQNLKILVYVYSILMKFNLKIKIYIALINVQK